MHSALLIVPRIFPPGPSIPGSPVARKRGVAGHLTRLDLGELRTGGACARVAELALELACLQVSEDPAESLTEGLRG